MKAIEEPIAIVVHGGATEIPPGEQEPHRLGCLEAANIGWQVLCNGGSALDAVEAAILHLENDPTFNAGRGAALTRDGRTQLDAGIMEGDSLKIGAVAAIEHYANPISIARRVLEGTEHHLLVGPGAERFAWDQSFTRIDNHELVVERERQVLARSHDTVGAVALDLSGGLAAGTSTGGLSDSLAGRVGDSPLPGAGFYADSRFGAVSCTGAGEEIMRVGLALRAIQALEDGNPAGSAATRAMELFQQRVPETAGLILLDRNGGIGLAHNSPHLAYAYRAPGMDEPASGLRVT
jgi:L-asparaginase / beta-aspartyl-peptidase